VVNEDRRDDGRGGGRVDGRRGGGGARGARARVFFEIRRARGRAGWGWDDACGWRLTVCA